MGVEAASMMGMVYKQYQIVLPNISLVLVRYYKKKRKDGSAQNIIDERSRR